jgi:hypothetical protein
MIEAGKWRQGRPMAAAAIFAAALAATAVLASSVMLAMPAMAGGPAPGGPAASAAPAAPTPEEPQEYPHAGIAAAWPKAFEPAVVSEPFDVFRAELRDKGKVVESISLLAFPVEPKVTAELYAEAMLAELAHNPAIRNFKAAARTAMKVAGVTGSAVRISYAYHGGEIAAIRLYFLREAGKARLCYVLSFQCDSDRQGNLQTMLTDTVKSVKFIPLQRPSAATMKDAGPSFDEPRLGLTIRPPHGWYVHMPKAENPPELAGSLPVVRTGLQIGQSDLAGGGEAAEATLLVADVAAGEEDANSCAQRMLQACVHLAAGGKGAGETAADMLGAAGRQTIIESPRPEGLKSEEEAPAKSFTVVRAACLAPNDKGVRKGYGLVLRCGAEDAAAAGAMMDRLAGGLAVSAHATSGPATSKPTR